MPLTSDGSANVLQAYDMLHGNLLLRHWRVSDVSFYTTELPQYMLVEALTGLGPWVGHAAAAMTYTLLVLLAALVAKGHARGSAGLARALLAGGLMLAPQLSATGILLLSPDHTGTAVPLLVIWLLIDRAGPRSTGGTTTVTPPGRRAAPPRTPRAALPHGGLSPPVPPGPPARTWFVPVLVGLMFALTMLADSIVLLTGIIPLVFVCLLRACLGPIRGGTRFAPRWYELALAGAASVAGVAGSFAPRLMTALGGYQQSHVGTATDLGQLQHGAWVTSQAFLELFGANVFGTSFPGADPVIEVVLVALHLAGAVAVTWTLGLAAARFLRFGELIAPVFTVAIVLNLAAYLISAHSRDLLGAREAAAVLPLGAVLAGRLLGERVLDLMRTARRWFVPALAAIAASYLAALGYGAAQPSAPPANQSLAGWLVVHRLTDGLAGYWQANSVTVDSLGQVVVSAVTYGGHGVLVPYQWETDEENYDPARHYANFAVADGPLPLSGMPVWAERTFGRPARIYHADGYTIMVWNTNLLDELDRPGPS